MSVWEKHRSFGEAGVTPGVESDIVYIRIFIFSYLYFCIFFQFIILNAIGSNYCTANEIWILQCFVIIYIFQTISIHFNPAIFKLYWLFIICANIYSYSCQWWLASLLVSNWLSLLLLCLTITPLPLSPMVVLPQPPLKSSFCQLLYIYATTPSPQSHLMTEQSVPGYHRGSFNKLQRSFCTSPLISACSCHSCQL